MKDKFLIKYDKLFSGYHRSNILGRAVLHLMIGNLVKNIEIPVGIHTLDPRVHILYAAPSGTGKSRILDIIRGLSDRLEMTYTRSYDPTIAALVGGYVIRKEGLEFVEGVISKSDILAIDIVTLSSRMKCVNSQLQTILNGCMSENPFSYHIRDQDPIIIEPATSFFLMGSVSPNDFVNLLKNFNPRCLTILDDCSPVKSYVISVESLNVKSHNYELLDVVNYLSDMQNYYIFGKKTGIFEINNRDIFDKRLSESIAKIGDIMMVDTLCRDLSERLYTTMVNMHFKIIYHSAMLRFSNEILVEDIEYADSVVIPIVSNYIDAVKNGCD